MDEAELKARLDRNPDLRRRNAHNAGIAGNADIARNTVIPSDENMRAEAEAMLESKVQSELRRLALAAGFLYYHTHNSKKSDTGFPDTVLLRVRLKTAELYLVECKRQGEDPTEEQQKWIQAIRSLRARMPVNSLVTVNGFVWRPMDLLTGEIERTLERPEAETVRAFLDVMEGDDLTQSVSAQRFMSRLLGRNIDNDVLRKMFNAFHAECPNFKVGENDCPDCSTCGV